MLQTLLGLPKEWEVGWCAFLWIAVILHKDPTYIVSHMRGLEFEILVELHRIPKNKKVLYDLQELVRWVIYKPQVPKPLVDFYRLKRVYAPNHSFYQLIQEFENAHATLPAGHPQLQRE